MLYRILCVGRRARDPLLDAADNYLERLSHYAKVELLRLRDGTMASERDDMQKRLRPGERVIALDERGHADTTVELAQRLQRFQKNGLNALTLLIGGAEGLHPDLKTRADECWTLSRLTLPHRLAQVVLLEQLYRAHTVMRGEPYHRP